MSHFEASKNLCAQSENRLLALLPKPEFDRLIPLMDVVPIALRDNLYRAEETIRYVYFVTAGVMSTTRTMRDGATIEVAAIGNEGMVGLPVFFGADASPAQVFCQLAGEARRMPAADFRNEVLKHGALHAVIERYATEAVNTPRWPLKILVVDDNEDAAESLALLLGLDGHLITIAATCKAAFGLSDEQPDVLIIELRLPDGDGCEVVKRFRERTAGPSLLVIALTTCSLTADRQRSADAGVDLHLLKASDPRILLEELSKGREKKVLFLRS